MNLGFYGHNHVYQRQSAVKDKLVVQAAVNMVDEDGGTYAYHNDPQATVQMVIGTGGAAFTKVYSRSYIVYCVVDRTRLVQMLSHSAVI